MPTLIPNLLKKFMINTKLELFTQYRLNCKYGDPFHYGRRCISNSYQYTINVIPMKDTDQIIVISH